MITVDKWIAAEWGVDDKNSTSVFRMKMSLSIEKIHHLWIFQAFSANEANCLFSLRSILVFVYFKK